MAQLAVPLPPTFVAWLWPYLDAFSGRTRSTLAALAVGAVLAVGPRTVANLLRTLGLAGEPSFAAFHRVLYRNRWSGLKLARTLLNALVSAIVSNDIPNWSFRVFGATAWLERCRSSRLQDPVTQQIELGAAAHGSLDGLQSADLPLYRPGAPRKRQRRADRREITREPIGKPSQGGFLRRG